MRSLLQDTQQSGDGVSVGGGSDQIIGISTAIRICFFNFNLFFILRAAPKNPVLMVLQAVVMRIPYETLHSA